MGCVWFDKDEERLLNERYDLAIGRVSEITQERIVPADFVPFFRSTGEFLLLCDAVKKRLESGAYDNDPKQMRADNAALYADILPEHYAESYADPVYATRMLGERMGKLLCFLYAQERGLIAYIFEGKLEETVAHVELFVQVYGIVASYGPGIESEKNTNRFDDENVVDCVPKAETSADVNVNQTDCEPKAETSADVSVNQTDCVPKAETSADTSVNQTDCMPREETSADASEAPTDRVDANLTDKDALYSHMAAGVKDAIYWFESDYADVIVAHRIREGIDPDCDFFTDILMHADLSNLNYLYRYGEYITENEIRMAEFLNSLPQEEIDLMADTWSEGYRMGFVLGGKPLEKKKTVNMRYPVGFERVARKAAGNFIGMGLRPTIYRYGVSAMTTNGAAKVGIFGANANPQYDYDHKEDVALMMDSRFMERRIDVTQTTYEHFQELANAHGGPAVMELFGEAPFEPESKMQAWSYDDSQRKLSVKMRNRLTQIVTTYIIGKERSFTIIAFPSTEIDKNRFEEIFRETIRVNTLDVKLYTKIQDTIIDALNKGTKAHILGANGNRTDLTVQFYELSDPQKETIFENCGADVNIPVGEVFTSPVLKGTNGVLHVSQVYLQGLNFLDLEIHFKDGMIESATCGNFDTEEENEAYISENILFHHPSLPMGEFAIGTNTTAYTMARRFDIAARLPILIAEKTGPHFAVGDTCYSWGEDNRIFNPDGKEIVAKENEVSACRKKDPSKAYFNCHTDITIPYEELGLIEVLGRDGYRAEIIRDGRFVLPGTEKLNEALDG